MKRRRRPAAPPKVDSDEALRVVQDLQKSFWHKPPTAANRAGVTEYLAKKYSPDYLRAVGARLLADVFKRTVPGKAGGVPEARRSGAYDTGIGTAGRAKATRKGKIAPKPRRAPRVSSRAASRRRRARS